MDLKKDMEIMKDDVKKGVGKVGHSMKKGMDKVEGVAEKVGMTMKHTAMDSKDDAKEIIEDVKNSVVFNIYF